MSDLPRAAEPEADGHLRSDVVIVGAGVAGLFAAVRLPDELSVTVVDKGEPGSGSSPLAQGGMAAAIGDEDSPVSHAADTLVAGDGLCDPAAVSVLVSEAPERVHELVDLGAEFDLDGSGALDLAREGGQSVARSVHRADATGAELVRVLRAAAVHRVTRLAGTAVAVALDASGRACGVWVADGSGALVLVLARAVLLATGGCGGLFAATTNRDGATGDGVALAFGAGAAVRDLEFVQFHPTGLAVSGAWRLLLTEALRGAGATLHGADGGRFMRELHPDAELAPRHIVAKGILAQEDGAWLDATHLGVRRLEEEFPTVLHGARRYGFDLAIERVPVTPAAHYMVGGVRTDLSGRTSVPGLYAAGEVASTGAHGANRMAGNSLSEAMVFAARVAAAVPAELGEGVTEPSSEPSLSGRTADLSELRARLRATMWRGCGPVRDARSLDTARSELDDLVTELGAPSPRRDHVELTHALRTAQLIVRAATLRRESRGGHWRTDLPDRDPLWDGVHVELISGRDG